MIITQRQAKLLVDLTGQIQDVYGIKLGYSNPTIPNPPQKDADFMILENPDVKELYCFHKDDLEVKGTGLYVVRVLPPEPKHDKKVEELLNRLNNDLLDGKIWFEPVFTKEVDGEDISVTRKKFPGTSEDIFETNVLTKAPDGNMDIKVYNYHFITAAAVQDKRFAAIKELIDEHWPQPKLDLEDLRRNLRNSLDALVEQLDKSANSQKKVKEKSTPKKRNPIMEFFSSLMSLFGV